MNKKKDETARLLDEIYKNAAMGAGTTKHLLNGQRGKELRESLQKQYAEYRAVCRSASNAAKARGRAVKGLTRMQKMRTDGGVSLNLLFDRSDSHVAKLLVNGSTMGVIKAQQELSKNAGADKEARALMQHLSDYELSTIDAMREYL